MLDVTKAYTALRLRRVGLLISKTLGVDGQDNCHSFKDEVNVSGSWRAFFNDFDMKVYNLRKLYRAATSMGHLR